MYIELDDRPIHLTGHYKGGSVERVTSWRGRASGSEDASGERTLHVHIDEGGDEFINEDEVTLSVASFEDLLLHGVIDVPSAQDMCMSEDQIFGEMRQLLHSGPIMARSWWRLCVLLDLVPESQRGPMVHYMASHLRRADRPEAQEIAARYRGGAVWSTRDAFGAICVAPRRWLEEVARGEVAEKHGLVRRIVADRKDLGLVERVLVTNEQGFEKVRSLEFWQVERRVTRSRTFKTPPHSLWRALCETPLLQRIERLRLCAMHDDFLAELQRHGTTPGALCGLDISAIPFAHRRIASELFEAPYFAGLEVLVCNGQQLLSYLRSSARGVRHLTLTERALDYIVDVLDDGRFAAKFNERLETLSFYDYPYGRGWKHLFASHYEGEIEELLLGVGFSHHTLELRKEPEVERMLQHAPFLKSVRTLKLGDMIDVIDVEALTRSQPHLEVKR